jgi:hypothetical protein
MLRHRLFPLISLVICAALLLAANQQTRPEGWTVFTVYGYWTGRIVIEAALFWAFFMLVGTVPPLRQRTAATLALAGLASYLPFVLSVTALDIVLGLPELEAAYGTDWNADMRIRAFFWELGYLFDNHLFLCGLLAIPLTGLMIEETDVSAAPDLIGQGAQGRDESTVTAPSSPDALPGQKSFFDRLSPPFTGQLIRAEAQEHYVKLVGISETRLVLYRFSDVLTELPETLGMQVHRSHWIAKDAIRSVIRKGNNTRIIAPDGAEIPVSRRYAGQVSNWIAENSKNAGRNVTR